MSVCVSFVHPCTAQGSTEATGTVGEGDRESAVAIDFTNSVEENSIALFNRQD